MKYPEKKIPSVTQSNNRRQNNKSLSCTLFATLNFVKDSSIEPAFCFTNPFLSSTNKMNFCSSPLLFYPSIVQPFFCFTLLLFYLLLFYPSIFLFFYCSTLILSLPSVVLPFYCSLLFYCSTLQLFYSSTVLPFYCSTLLLFNYPTVSQKQSLFFSANTP